jgi:hypothetical protein
VIRCAHRYVPAFSFLKKYLCLHFSGNLGVEYVETKRNKTNGEKNVQMGLREGGGVFPALLRSHWARESESRIPSQAGTKHTSLSRVGPLLSLGSPWAHPNNYTAPLSEPVIVYGRAAVARPAVKIKGCK